jgi:Bacteriocin-protection, YdeI or OmpD-Associated
MDALLQKMKFVARDAVAIVGAPRSFLVTEALQAMGVAYVEAFQEKAGWLVVCVMNRVEVGECIPKALAALAANGLLWICYPKKSGKIKTDLSRDHGWEAIEGLGLRHVNLISIDSDWTAWGVMHASDAAREKTHQKSTDRNELLAQYIDHTTREMRYPPEMQAILDAHPTTQAFFLNLSFTNRKEYLAWIVNAKRPETRQQRLDKLIDYLSEGRKNPTDR